MNPKKRLVEQGKRDVEKAGRMFLEAVFGDTDDFIRKLGEEGDSACPSSDDEGESDSDALTVEVHPPPSSSPFPRGRR